MQHLFRSIILPRLTYGLIVYGSSPPELSSVRNYLDRCYKRKYILDKINIYNLINEFGNRLFNTIKEQIEHPLYNILPRLKVSKYHLRKKSTVKPKINTERFKGTFINRLVFSNLGIFN